MADHAQIDEALRRFGFYRLEQDARLPSRDTVEAEATAAGVTLPDDYTYFCSAHGAGAFDKHALLALPRGCPLGPNFRVDILYAIGAGEDWNPISLLEDTYLDRLPEDFLPIGTDPGGNLLLLGAAGRQGVYAWDHEHRELADGEFDRRIAELERANVDTQEFDIDQLLLLWERMFPSRVANPSGHGNLYRLADTFASALAALRGDR
jgi:hypothetical protein